MKRSFMNSKNQRFFGAFKFFEFGAQIIENNLEVYNCTSVQNAVL